VSVGLVYMVLERVNVNVFQASEFLKRVWVFWLDLVLCLLQLTNHCHRRCVVGYMLAVNYSPAKRLLTAIATHQVTVMVYRVFGHDSVRSELAFNEITASVEVLAWDKNSFDQTAFSLEQARLGVLVELV
jgi:hypothetical protein